MKVYQIRVKLYFLRDIPARDIIRKMTAFIDQELTQDESLAALHSASGFKMYCYDNPYPIPADRLYKKDQIYTVTIRTVEAKLAEFFSEKLIHTHTEYMKGLTGELKIIPKGFIYQIYSLTPIIIKPEGGGYWNGKVSIQEYERHLFENLVKKWNEYHGEKIEEDFPFYTLLEFKNSEPIPFGYKDITLLGDKVCLSIADNERAQNLAYFSLGTGIGTMNGRGAGFMNYRFL